jgi:putative hydrolase of the HAD superfamily
MVVEAVIFDWGGTLTPWQDGDGLAWTRIAGELASAGLVPVDRIAEVAATLAAAEDSLWVRCRDEHRSGTMLEVFQAAGLSDVEAAWAAYHAEWDWATRLDPAAPPVLEGLRERGIRVGVLSNTAWPRRRHEEIFRRDGVHHLIDGAVYSSEIPFTKPHPAAFQAAMGAVGVAEPTRCVFVGDRLFDDIHGATRAGMRAVFLPHSRIPEVQLGPARGRPDAVIQHLGELLPLVDGWSAGSGR